MTPTTLLTLWVWAAIALLFILVFFGMGLRFHRLRVRLKAVRFSAGMRRSETIIGFARASICVIAAIPAIWLAVGVPDQRGVLLAPSLWGLLAIIGFTATDRLVLGGTTPDGVPRRASVRSCLPIKPAVFLVMGLAALLFAVGWARSEANIDQRSHVDSWVLDGYFDWGVIRPFPGSYYTTPLLWTLPVLLLFAGLGALMTLRRPIYRPTTGFVRYDRFFRRRTIRDLTLIPLAVIATDLAILGIDIAWGYSNLGPGSSRHAIVVAVTFVVGVVALGMAFWALANLFFLPVPRTRQHRLATAMGGATWTGTEAQIRLDPTRRGDHAVANDAVTDKVIDSDQVAPAAQASNDTAEDGAAADDSTAPNLQDPDTGEGHGQGTDGDEAEQGSQDGKADDQTGTLEADDGGTDEADAQHRRSEASGEPGEDAHGSAPKTDDPPDSSGAGEDGSTDKADAKATDTTHGDGDRSADKAPDSSGSDQGAKNSADEATAVQTKDKAGHTRSRTGAKPAKTGREGSHGRGSSRIPPSKVRACRTNPVGRATAEPTVEPTEKTTRGRANKSAGSRPRATAKNRASSPQPTSLEATVRPTNPSVALDHDQSSAASPPASSQTNSATSARTTRQNPAAILDEAGKAQARATTPGARPQKKVSFGVTKGGSGKKKRPPRSS
ncbi:MAG: hypothetical protein LBV06_06320 [Propionibacteriaceae bacterium]|jgi:hypothetical protein|nr:hypothetical protein [Propionibacteriaceae bacterium]